MSEDLKRKLGYKPKIEYEESYESSLGMIDSNVAPDDDSEDKNDEITDLGDLLGSLDTMVNGLPGNIGDSISNIFDHVEDMWEDELKDKEYGDIPGEYEYNYKIDTPKDDEDDKDNPDDNKDPEDNELEEDPFAPPIDLPKVEEINTPKKDVIEKEYIKHLTDVIEDYATKLHKALSNFWANVLIATYNKSTDDKKFIMNNILLSSKDVLKDKAHLLDLGIKSQIYKNVKLDFYDNMFSREETIMHLKQFKIAYEMRKKYANINTPVGTTKTTAMDANMLKAMTINYDKKYDVSYANLYRYLNSSVIVVDDVLKTYLQEIKAKQILVEGEGRKK